MVPENLFVLVVKEFLELEGLLIGIGIEACCSGILGRELEAKN